MTGPTTDTEVRTSAGTVQEIHLDFLLWEELSANAEFLRSFIIECVGVDDLEKLLDVRRSVSDNRGEADLIARYVSKSGDRVGILIEDKVGAGFQPDQAKRYVHRGDDGMLKEWDRYVTVLVAPEKYVEQGHAFQRAISLETLSGWITSPNEIRRAFRLEILSRAINQQKTRGPKVVDEVVTKFRLEYYEHLKQHFPELIMTKPGPAWSGEVWFRLNHRLLPKKTYIHHKAPLGVVDLSFPYTDMSALKSLSQCLEYRMEIVPTGKSCAIRLGVPPINDFKDFSSQSDKLATVFDAAMRLAYFSDREREKLPQLSKGY